MRMIDISHHNSITLDASLEHYDGVIVRAYYGNKYTQIDKKFNAHMEQLGKLAGEKKYIPYALYFYSYAADTDYAYQEASRMKDFLDTAIKKAGYPPFCIFGDYEEFTIRNSGNVTAIMEKSLNTLNDIAIEFNIDYGMYCSQSWINLINMSSFSHSGSVQWIARWSEKKPYVPYDIWQYTSRYILNGSRVDMSLVSESYKKAILNFYRNEHNITLACDSNAPTVPSPDVPSTGCDDTGRNEMFLSDESIDILAGLLSESLKKWVKIVTDRTGYIDTDMVMENGMDNNIQ